MFTKQRRFLGRNDPRRRTGRRKNSLRTRSAVLESLEARHLLTGVVNLTSPGGFLFDIEAGEFGAGQLINGTNDAFDGTNKLQVGGADYTPALPVIPGAQVVFDAEVSGPSVTIVSSDPFSQPAVITQTVNVAGSSSVPVHLSAGFTAFNDSSYFAIIDALVYVDGSLSGNQRYWLEPQEPDTGADSTNQIAIDTFSVLSPGNHTVEVRVRTLSGTGAYVTSSANPNRALRLIQFNEIPNVGPSAEIIFDAAVSGPYVGIVSSNPYGQSPVIDPTGIRARLTARRDR